MFDKHLDMHAHVTSGVKLCMLYTLNISWIRQYIDQFSCQTLIHAVISSRMDYSDCLLYGLPRTQIERLQKIRNIAVRVVSKRRKFDHINPVLNYLHWLKFEQRILYNLILFTFKAIHWKTSNYLSELVQVYEPKRSLRLKNRQTLLVLPKYNTTTYGTYAFKIGVPTELNNLPEHLRTITDFEQFKTRIKYIFV